MDDKPDWYWKRGLHDADIKCVAYQQFDCDYTQKNPIRNSITISLDSRNALFDTTIDSIVFYNAKMITNDIDYAGTWWVNDELSFSNNKFHIKIFIESKIKKSCIQIQFDRAEVIRAKVIR